MTPTNKFRWKKITVDGTKYMPFVNVIPGTSIAYVLQQEWEKFLRNEDTREYSGVVLREWRDIPIALNEGD